MMLDLLIALTELAMVVVPIITFIRLRRRVATGRLSRWPAVAWFGFWTLLPLLLYLLLFALLVAIEELFSTPMVSEGMGRTVLLLALAEMVILPIAVGLFTTSLLLLPQR